VVPLLSIDDVVPECVSQRPSSDSTCTLWLRVEGIQNANDKFGVVVAMCLVSSLSLPSGIVSMCSLIFPDKEAKLSARQSSASRFFSPLYRHYYHNSYTSLLSRRRYGSSTHKQNDGASNKAVAVDVALLFLLAVGSCILLFSFCRKVRQFH